MPNFQKYIAIGHLTQDPDLRGLNDGSSVCNLSMAVNSGYGDNKKTFFFAVKVFGKSADFCKSYLHKGSCVIVEGEWTRDEYTDKSGQKQSKSYVIASKIQFGESKQGGQSYQERREPEYNKWDGREQRDTAQQAQMRMYAPPAPSATPTPTPTQPEQVTQPPDLSGEIPF